MSLTIAERSVNHNTFVIERSYPAPPERVFAAFSDPAKKRRWYLEGEGHEIQEFEMDFRVGGRERTRLIIKKGGPYDNAAITNNSTYQDIVPNRRIVIAYTMALGDQRISSSLATFELLPNEQGTNLIFTHQAAFFEGADGPQMREGGWRRLLDHLGRELAR